MELNRPIIPSLRDGLLFCHLPGTSCQATIIQSLRDGATIIRSLRDGATIIRSLRDEATIIQVLRDRARIVQSLRDEAKIIQALRDGATMIQSLRDGATFVQSLRDLIPTSAMSEPGSGQETRAGSSLTGRPLHRQSGADLNW